MWPLCKTLCIRAAEHLENCQANGAPRALQSIRCVRVVFRFTHPACLFITQGSCACVHVHSGESWSMPSI